MVVTGPAKILLFLPSEEGLVKSYVINKNEKNKGERSKYDKFHVAM